MNKRLLLLDRYLEEDNPTLDLATYLGVSNRQLTRLLKHWSESGLISYTAGSGRGIKKQIDINVDIEKELFHYVINNKDKLSIKELEEYLALPWHPESIKVILELIEESKTPEDEEHRISIMDFVYGIPNKIHPFYTKDIVGTQVNFQIFHTLYCISDTGEIEYQLLKYDEWINNELHMYLKKNVYFSDGSNFTAHDVKFSLDQIRKEGAYQKFLDADIEVVVVNDYHVKLVCPTYSDILKYTLTEPFVSMVKVVDGKVIGTGPYYLYKHTPEEIELRVNKFYNRKVDVTVIYFIANLSKYFDYHTKKYKHTVSTTCYSGTDFLLFNPLHKDLTIEQRAFVSRVAVATFYNHLDFHTYLYKWLNHKPQEMLLTVPKFERPLVILADRYTRKKLTQLCNALATYGVAAEIREIDHELYINSHLTTFDCDLVWMSESYHHLQPYKTFNLLTHCKVHEWYEVEEKGKAFLETMYHKEDAKDVKGLAEDYLNYLESSYYMIPLIEKHRKFIVPTHMTNVKVKQYGIIDYSHILSKDL
ncbi:ABC transporter substrate-binding protein [Macrococcus sp. DPC7161]|uniref:ABC transporter substrate-binding protein n=1 Tax=Macrococcus sp. DPC7161 TaxID=2507060 RepID=UPI00100BC745|nr:ABC transporter substrate-binding protein [Macrococcus sp. DPC7161]RXK18421.1 hypothetical protein ER639_03855 [Macrococcus sp. DPC7161]